MEVAAGRVNPVGTWIAKADYRWQLSAARSLTPTYTSPELTYQGTATEILPYGFALGASYYMAPFGHLDPGVTKRFTGSQWHAGGAAHLLRTLRQQEDQKREIDTGSAEKKGRIN